MLFSLPWDLRAKIWARARFLAARDALVAHLPARGRSRRLDRYDVVAYLPVSAERTVVVSRSKDDSWYYDNRYTVIRGLEHAKVLITENMQGSASLHVVDVVIDEDWFQRTPSPGWVHVTEAGRIVRNVWTGGPY